MRKEGEKRGRKERPKRLGRMLGGGPICSGKRWEIEGTITAGCGGEE